MYIIAVTPLGVTSPAHRDGLLTYYSKTPFAEGDIVHVAIGRIRMRAVVRSSTPLAKNKILLKTQAFALKRIGTLYASSTGLATFCAISDALAQSFFTQSGAILKLLLPAILLDRPEDAFPLPTPPQGTLHTKSLIIGGEAERALHYQSLARKNKGTLVIICPTIGALSRLSLSIPEATVLSPKHGIRALRTILHSTLYIPHSTSHALHSTSILLTTPAFLAFLPATTHTIICDDAFSPHLAREESPRIHLRALIDAYAKQQKLPLVLAASHWVPDALAYEHQATVLGAELPIAIVNMQSEQIAQKTYLLLSRYARDRIAEPGRALIIVNRKGYAPLVLCTACSATRGCESCDAPLTAHGSETAPTYQCHHCGKLPPMPLVCRSCNGTTFAHYGVGVARMAEHVRELFPKRTVLMLDGDVRERAQRDIMTAFHADQNAILVSTEAAFEHPLPPIATGVAASIDHLFSLPEYRTEESIARLILRLGDSCARTMVQTRMPERSLWKELDTAHRALALARRLLSERSRAKLPPAIILVQCTVRMRDPVRAEALAQQLGVACVRIRVLAHVAPAFIPRERNHYVWHVLIRLPLKTWTDAEHPVRGLLAQLGHEWSVSVNPKNTL